MTPDLGTLDGTSFIGSSRVLADGDEFEGGGGRAADGGGCEGGGWFLICNCGGMAGIDGSSTRAESEIPAVVSIELTELAAVLPEKLLESD